MYRGYSYGGYKYAYSMPKTFLPPQKYPQDIQCVFKSQDPEKGSIYVSNVQAAQNYQTLAKYKIKAVMTCARGYDRNIPKSKLDMFQYFPFDDKETCIISPYFDKACDFIMKALERTNILVHCIAGVSRSVSMVLAYLIREKNMSYEKAYNQIKLRRKIISPNEGFIKQLKQYAKQIKNRMNMTYSQKLSIDRPSSRQKTPEMRNESTPIPNNGNYYYNTTIKRTNTNKYKYKDQQIQNQQDGTDIKLKRDYTQTFKSIDMNNYSATIPSKNSQNKEQNQNINKQQDVSHQNITKLTKSSTFIQNNYISKTPQKRKQPSPIKNTQQASMTKSYQKGNQNLNYMNKQQSRTSYFQQMNRQLNQKIDQIHQRYQRQRQKLMGKRKQYSSANKNTSIHQQPGYLHDYQYRKPSITFTNKKYQPYVPKYDTKYDLYNGNYNKYDQYERYDRLRNNPTKYADLYDNKYSRGLNYADVGAGLYRRRY